MKTKDRFLAFVIFSSILLAWIGGIFRHRADIAPFLKQALPAATHFEPVSNTVYAGLAEPLNKKVGFVAISSAAGYAGPVKVAVGLDTNAKIVAAVIIRQTESPAFFRKVIANGLPEKYVGKTYADQFEIGSDIDAVTGATASLTALTKAVQLACRDIAGNHLGLPRIAKDTSKINFGLSEVALILLFIVGLAAYSKKLTIKRYLKWSLLIASLVLIGIVFKKPISLIHINSLLVGYWPKWQNDLYWYLLIIAVLMPVVLKAKSPYCTYICPFGAAQQILITLGGAKIKIPQKFSFFLKFLQRTLAWCVVICALLFRNPAVIHYEVSATFFTLIGQNWQFILLAFVLIISLFITRPWCNYLCPVCAVNDYIRLLRRCFTRGLGKLELKTQDLL